MKRSTTYLTALVLALTVLGGRTAAAQQIRSFAPPDRDRGQNKDVPREYLPPAGMCRIWVDGVPAKQQPAPTDCSTAIRNKPRNGRVIFGEEASDDGKKGKDAKEKPRRPESDGAGP